MTARVPIYDWALMYCGDPASHVTRGSTIRAFLVEDGLKPTHRLLDLGCGALSQGRSLITYLEPGNYVGADPNGWLIESALEQHPELLSRDPTFSYRADFDAAEFGPFDYVVSHSVMSHMAHWQMEQALTNVRKACTPGAVWLSSLRLDQYDLFAQDWVYPGVSYFRLQTVEALAFHAGWMVEQVPEYSKRLKEVAPNDFHDWIRLRATLTTDEANERRMAMEIGLKIRQAEVGQAQLEYEAEQGRRIAELTP